MIHVWINLSILIATIIGTGFLVWKTKFEDNNYRLLFILYTLCWIGPMMLREYTSQMHTWIGADIGQAVLYGNILWVPLIMYGIISLFWKPLNDIMSYHLKNRKMVIYISLGIQVMAYLPMFIYPCLATNIIQSLGCGIGASCIGIFNLMFNEQHAKKHVFLTVTLLSLPPLIAEFVSSVLQSLVTSFIKSETTAGEKIDIVKWMWLVSIIFIIIAAILAIFVKENRKLLFKDNKYKEPVSTKWDWMVVIFVCLATCITSFTKFTTSGPASITQLDFIATKWWGKNSIAGWDGYLSTVFTAGQIGGNLLMGLVLSRKWNKWLMFSLGTGIWIAFMILTSSVGLLNPMSFLFINVLNGLAFGMAYNIIVGVVMNKYFERTNKFTPVSLYNTFLSVGIVASTFFNPWMKKTVFGEFTKLLSDPKWDGSISNELWSNFIKLNWIVNIVVIATLIIMWGLFTASYFIQKKHPPTLKRTGIRYQAAGDMDD